MSYEGVGGRGGGGVGVAVGMGGGGAGLRTELFNLFIGNVVYTYRGHFAQFFCNNVCSGIRHRVCDAAAELEFRRDFSR